MEEKYKVKYAKFFNRHVGKPLENRLPLWRLCYDVWRSPSRIRSREWRNERWSLLWGRLLTVLSLRRPNGVRQPVARPLANCATFTPWSLPVVASIRHRGATRVPRSAFDSWITAEWARDMRDVTRVGRPMALMVVRDIQSGKLRIIHHT